MFTGYNSDVEFDGEAFHVQTEDKGLDNPVVESRVYRGGQVVASVLTSYADLADSPDYSQDRIQRRMQEQHQSLIEDLQMGRLEAEPTIRRKALARVLDPDDLIEEYVEDWIEASNLTAPIHQALEQGIDAVQEAAAKKKKKEKRRKRARGNLALLVLLISVCAAFELGRVSQRSFEPGPESATHNNASVSPTILERAAPDNLPEPTVPVMNDLPEPVAEPVLDPESEREASEPPAGVETTGPVSGPFEAHEVDRPPTSVLSQPPVDTPASLKAVRGGSVRMNVLVGTDGGIEAVRMLDETTDSDLNKAALGAIRHWRFNAGSHRGVPVSVWVPVRLDFSLAENRMRSVVTVIR
jgi:TonB family protein